MKKNHLAIFLAIIGIVLVFNACKKDDELGFDTPDHRVVFTSEMDFLNTIEVDGSISFGDVSPGVESRTWTFPAGVVDIVDSDNDATSDAANVKAIFTEVGQFDVKLEQTFKDNPFVGTTQQDTKMLDTTITVIVLDSIQANFEAFYLNDDGTTGDALIIGDMASNEIPAGEKVRFTYTGTGSPREITWSTEGGSPEVTSGNQLSVDVAYPFLGTYDIGIFASRARPFGEGLIEFEDFITVVPSTEPVVAEEITDRDGDIAVVFGRALDIESLTPTDFSVTIENNGEIINTTIGSVTITPSEQNVVLISLDGESIYNDDIIKVSYTPGTLFSADGVAAEPFTDEILFFSRINILEQFSDIDYGFENSMETNWVGLGWDGFDDYTIDIGVANTHSGGRAMYIEMPANGGMILAHQDDNGMEITFPSEAGKVYEVGSWTYVDNLGNATVGLPPDFRIYVGPEPDFGLGPNPEFNVEYPLNTWVYNSTFMEFAEGGDKTLLFRAFNGSNPEMMSFYLDDVTVSEVSLRPQ